MHLDTEARHPLTQAAAQPLKLIYYFSTLYSCLYHRQRLRHDIMRRFWASHIAFTIRNSGTSQLFASQIVVFTLHFSGLQKKDVNVRHVLYTTAFYLFWLFSSFSCLILLPSIQSIGALFPPPATRGGTLERQTTRVLNKYSGLTRLVQAGRKMA